MPAATLFARVGDAVVDEGCHALHVEPPVLQLRLSRTIYEGEACTMAGHDIIVDDVEHLLVVRKSVAKYGFLGLLMSP